MKTNSPQNLTVNVNDVALIRVEKHVYFQDSAKRYPEVIHASEFPVVELVQNVAEGLIECLGVAQDVLNLLHIDFRILSSGIFKRVNNITCTKKLN